MNTQSIPSFTAFVGLDWADRKHDFCLQPAASDQREFGTLDHTPEVIEKWAYSLREAAGATIVKPAQVVFRGGHSGYFTDPDGFYWEVAFAPGFQFAADGSLILDT